MANEQGQVNISNAYAGTIPARSAVEVTGRSGIYYTVTRPSAANLGNAIVLFSGPVDIPQNGHGIASTVWPFVCTTGDSPSAGDAMGTIADSFLLAKDNTGFQLMGEEGGFVFVRPFSVGGVTPATPISIDCRYNEDGTYKFFWQQIAVTATWYSTGWLAITGSPQLVPAGTYIIWLRGTVWTVSANVAPALLVVSLGAATPPPTAAMTMVSHYSTTGGSITLVTAAGYPFATELLLPTPITVANIRFQMQHSGGASPVTLTLSKTQVAGAGDPILKLVKIA